MKSEKYVEILQFNGFGFGVATISISTSFSSAVLFRKWQAQSVHFTFSHHFHDTIHSSLDRVKQKVSQCVRNPQGLVYFSVMHRTMYCHPEAHDKTPGQETKARERKRAQYQPTPIRANKWYQNGILPKVLKTRRKEESDLSITYSQSCPFTPGKRRQRSMCSF